MLVPGELPANVNPVEPGTIEVPGERPTLPLIRVVDPVLVTVELPSTAKLPAVPRMPWAWALTANTEKINKPKLNTFIFPADVCPYLLI
jgi:hypothetical protein